MILDGTTLNKKIAEDLKKKISSMDTVPTMVAIQIGNNPASTVYLGRKMAYAKEIGAVLRIENLPIDVTETDVMSHINALNADKNVHGVIVQLPIPAQLNFQKIVNAVHPDKDVDGLGATNIYKLVNHIENGLVPATARAVVTLLQKNNIDLGGADAVVVGRSLLVGKSSALHLLNQNATVTVCHSKTKNLADKIKSADIVVLASGHPGIATDDTFREGQVVVDVGITVIDGKIYGDANVKNPNKLRAISPVPGGVGPMTVASLFENLVQAYEMQNR